MVKSTAIDRLIVKIAEKFNSLSEEELASREEWVEWCQKKGIRAPDIYLTSEANRYRSDDDKAKAL